MKTLHTISRLALGLATTLSLAGLGCGKKEEPKPAAGDAAGAPGGEQGQPRRGVEGGQGADEAKPKGTQLTQEIAVHVVGNERPALLYTMLVLYQPPVR